MRLDSSVFEGPCACGRTHKLTVQDIHIESGALLRIQEFLMKPPYDRFHRPFIICDDHTYKAAGRLVCSALEAESIILNADRLCADETAVATAAAHIPAYTDLLIAVGAGTIHDITRYIAKEKHIPFISAPTAASVDGFVSTVAAMTWRGFKKTFPACSPIAVIADTDIIRQAPYRLTASGVSDLLGKYTALADWKIANLLTGEWICPSICGMEEEALNKVCAVLSDLPKGNAQAYEQLMYGLLLSGLAMQMAGNSRPASGCEHHMSHLWEMQVISPHIEAYHGEKVGVGLLECARRYHISCEAIRNGTVKVDSYEGIEQKLLQDTFGKTGMIEDILAENTPDPLAETGDFTQKLSAVADILAGVPSVQQLTAWMQSGQCKLYPEQIGLSAEQMDLTARLSPYVRNRLTWMRCMKRLRFEGEN